MVKKFLLPCIFLFSLIFIGCSATTKEGAIGIQRSQFMIVSSEEAFAGGNSFYLTEVKNADKNKTLNPSSAQTKRLKNIASKLIPYTSVFRDDAVKWQWEVNVMQDPQINAYCAGQGKIMFYTGILDKITTTDDEIAAVMGHEIAHALREHSRERMSQAYVQNIGLNIAAILTKNDQLTMKGATLLSQVALTLPYSREHEREADRIGLELMARAGYNPKSAVKVWEKMQKLSGGGGMEFLSTHPSNESRIEDLKSYLPIADKLYKESGGGR